jgi:hypothetical protein
MPAGIFRACLRAWIRVTEHGDEKRRCCWNRKAAVSRQRKSGMRYERNAASPRRSFFVFRPVSGLAKAPLPLPGRVISRPVVTCRRGLARGHRSRLRGAMRTTMAPLSLTVAGAAQVDPIHGRRAPCFPFNCMRTSAHTSTRSACECRPRASCRQGNASRARLSDGACVCYRMRAFGARTCVRVCS